MLLGFILPLKLTILYKTLATCTDLITLSANTASTITSVCFGFRTVKAIKDSISYLKCVLLVINQTQKTVFDHVFKHREERCNTARSGVVIFDERILRFGNVVKQS